MQPESRITIERLERALALCAYLVILDGPVAAPLFERLERELAAMQTEQDVLGRAQRTLEHYRSEHNGSWPTEISVA